ncbi:MAG: SWIM zinc finger family protein, partial [Prevotellaceae bacterium]|nr:SWIM zinc finger family protein [Prevotellaceae bacterium]
MAQKQYGVTPWGKWFLDTLFSFGYEERLARGKSYANTGKVEALNISDGKVTAKIKGHYMPYYKVSVEFSPLPPEKQKQVEQILHGSPAYLVSITQGNLPEDFYKKIKSEHIPLVPEKWGEMKRSCNCPDYGDPCKHMAALFYVLIQEIDTDPALIFRLRGIDLDKIVKQFGVSSNINIKEDSYHSINTRDSILNRTLEPPFVIKDFLYTEGLKSDIHPTAPVFTEIPHFTSLITSLLPPQPTFCTERDFAVVFAEFYHHHARWGLHDDTAILSDEKKLEETQHSFSRSKWRIVNRNNNEKFELGSQIIFIQEDIQGNLIKHNLYDVFRFFRSFSDSSNFEATMDYQFLFYLFKYLNLLIISGAFIPCPVIINTTTNEKSKTPEIQCQTLKIIWLAYTPLPEIKNTLKEIALYENFMLETSENYLNAQKTKSKAKSKVKPKEKYFAESDSVVNIVSTALITEHVHSNAVYFKPQGNKGSESFRTIIDVFFKGETLDVTSPVMRSIPFSINKWLTVLYTDFDTYKYRLTLKTSTSKTSGNIFRLKMSMQAIIGGVSTELKDAVSRANNLDVLNAPTALSNYLPEIRILTSRNEVALSEERFVDFLDNAADLLSKLGIEAVLPKTFHKTLKPRLVLKADSSESEDAKNSKKKKNLVSYLNLTDMLDFHWEIAIGDQTITQDELSDMLKQKSAIVKFRDQFIRIDPAELSSLFKKAEAQNKLSAISNANEFLKAHFGGDTVLTDTAQKIVKEIFDEQKLKPPENLNAVLRPYQISGFNWVLTLLLSGFGCILADDMGLGKTIQSIAVLLHLKQLNMLKNNCLVIAPAALLENWEREINKFAPSLSVYKYHGSNRKIDGNVDVALTTYQTAARD